MPSPSATGLASTLERAGKHTVLAPVVGSDYSHRDRAIRRLLATSDVSGLLAAFAVLGTLSHKPSFGLVMLTGLVSLPLWLLVFNAYGLYRRDHTRIGHTTIDDIPWLFHAVLLGCPVLWFAFRWLPGDEHFGKILIFGAVAGIGILVLRAITRGLLGRLVTPERLLLIGDSEAISALARKLIGHPRYGVEPVGIVSVPGREVAARTDGEGPPVVCDYRQFDLERLAAEHRIDRIVVSHGDIDDAALLELVRRCKQLSIKVSVLPELTDAMGPSVQVDDVQGLTLIAINPPVLSPSSRAAKRAMDLIGASLLVLLTAPMALAIALAIKFDSSGPVLFRQERVGRRGRRFALIKFRTMVGDAEQQRAALLAMSKDPQWLHLDHDPRITRVGRALRHSSLDELPQLWNVLRGEMSLVGPRPLIPSEDANLIGWARTRLDLMPGVSGLWQVLGRTDIPFDEMLKLDYLYVTNWSLWGDVRLMLRTLPAVLLRRGAN